MYYLLKKHRSFPTITGIKHHNHPLPFFFYLCIILRFHHSSSHAKSLYFHSNQTKCLIYWTYQFLFHFWVIEPSLSSVWNIPALLTTLFWLFLVHPPGNKVCESHLSTLPVLFSPDTLVPRKIPANYRYSTFVELINENFNKKKAEGSHVQKVKQP